MLMAFGCTAPEVLIQPAFSKSMVAPASYFGAKKSTMALSALVSVAPRHASMPRRHGTRAASYPIAPPGSLISLVTCTEVPGSTGVPLDRFAQSVGTPFVPADTLVLTRV